MLDPGGGFDRWSVLEVGGRNLQGGVNKNFLLALWWELKTSVFVCWFDTCDSVCVCDVFVVDEHPFVS